MKRMVYILSSVFLLVLLACPSLANQYEEARKRELSLLIQLLTDRYQKKCSTNPMTDTIKSRIYAHAEQLYGHEHTGHYGHDMTLEEVKKWIEEREKLMNSEGHYGMSPGEELEIHCDTYNMSYEDQKKKQLEREKAREAQDKAQMERNKQNNED